MAKITLQQAIQYASAAGFNLNNGIDTILAIAMAESGLNTDAYNSAVQATGILQIALLYHPDVTKAQALDPAFSFRYAYKLSGGGKNFCPWQSYDCKICGNCGKNGWDNRYKQFLPSVQAALHGSTLSSASAVTTMVSNVVSTTKNALSLTSNASVAQALVSFDDGLSITNPFIFDTSGMQDNVFGVQFTDPIQWLQQFGSNIVGDFVALVVRSIFIALGVFLLYRVIDHYVNFSGNLQTAASNVGSLASSLGKMVA